MDQFRKSTNQEKKERWKKIELYVMRDDKKTT